MKANLAVFDITLSPSAMAQLSARPQDKCAGDAKWYEVREPACQSVGDGREAMVAQNVRSATVRPCVGP